MTHRSTSRIVMLVSLTTFLGACTTTSSDELVLTEMSPISGPQGTAVTLKGNGFGTSSGGSKVTFSSYAAAIMRWTNTEIVALVPSAAGFGAVQVAVERGARFTATLTFTVTDASVAAPRPGSPAPIAVSPGDFTTEAPCGVGRVCLAKVTGSPGTLVLAVQSQDLGDTSGIAFELGYDPAVLRPRATTPGSALTSPVISHAAEAVAGQLLTGVAELPRWDGRGTNLGGLRTVWTITFDVLSRASTDVTFLATSRQARDRNNRPFAVTWVGGRLEAVQ